MDKKQLQTFFRMVAQVSEGFGSGDEILYVVDRDEKLALEMAKEFIERRLAEDLGNASTVPNQISLGELLAGYASPKSDALTDKPHVWNERANESGSREWTLGPCGDGIRSDDIFQCGGKKCFESFAAAEKAAESYTAVKKERFRAYRCSMCQNYHIGGDR